MSYNNNDLQAARQVAEQEEQLLSELGNDVSDLTREQIQITLNAFLNDYNKPLTKLQHLANDYDSNLMSIKAVSSRLESIAQSMQQFTLENYNDSLNSLKSAINDKQAELDSTTKEIKQAQYELDSIKRRSKLVSKRSLLVSLAIGLIVGLGGLYGLNRTFKDKAEQLELEYQTKLDNLFLISEEDQAKFDEKKATLTTAKEWDKYFDYVLENYYKKEFIAKFGERPTK